MSRDTKRLLRMLPLLLASASAVPGEVAIEHARFVQSGNAWLVSVTLRHADTGWDHYADGWEVVAEDGTPLGRRVLAHPHVDEQPFTRSLRLDAPLPGGPVFVRARLFAWPGVPRFSGSVIRIGACSQFPRRATTA